MPYIVAAMAGIMSTDPNIPGCQGSATTGRMARNQKVFARIHIRKSFSASHRVLARAEMCFRIMMWAMSEVRCVDMFKSSVKARIGVVDIMNNTSSGSQKGLWPPSGRSTQMSPVLYIVLAVKKTPKLADQLSKETAFGQYFRTAISWKMSMAEWQSSESRRRPGPMRFNSCWPFPFLPPLPSATVAITKAREMTKSELH
mmetsp:Transcript_89757/g.159569  ORF Transcript_89757/g.159569 Transcript_89757/m.159569 type:complete len:200 (-) Transcript_89757:727-1326(-)